ncbi:putative Rossmann fold nucleotide-binding protein DprA/Smf involved in DNA uptake [Allostreptomyces psammosilenae]|uniref:Putative Rossmann fold nucleotide-binding protein DprA/Smf involved in DNA uptake n=2 Tax=Allostreptomyces psammosilenae TaxID=1892865 RepID=A0A853A8R6_9ACTN|nr:putative Rossmann fold nucleotide-binding protein DprA/Smf involved in DNA uptake [Allostreptomyces psammosilenae]
MNLTDSTVDKIRAALADLLATRSTGDLVGVSCLARGSDTLFAEAVLDAGGRLVVVLPSQDYRQAKVKPDHAETFDRLVAAAAEVRTAPHATASREAYEAANEIVLGMADELVAVWDGVPSGGRGGTADVVESARERGIPVTVVWPEGAERS